MVLPSWQSFVCFQRLVQPHNVAADILWQVSDIARTAVVVARVVFVVARSRVRQEVASLVFLDKAILAVIVTDTRRRLSSKERVSAGLRFKLTEAPTIARIA